jgi:predicted ATP-grasp superfamily ATP-dependent carboligase
VRFLVLGVSTRAMVESAVRGGHDVVAVDFFGDRDQARTAESYALQRDLGLPLTAEGLAEAARRVSADAVVYGSNLENHPEVVADLACRCRLLGNPAEVLREVRDWALLRRFCGEAGIAHPVTLLRGEERRAARGRWLRKRLRSGGGHGIAEWDGRALDDAHLLQAEVDGRAASVAFVADGKESHVFGITEQIIGRSALGGSGFAWCGNLLPLELNDADAASVRAQIDQMATRLTRRFGLVGVNGLDVVVGRDPEGVARPYLIEVNPRFSGSMELAERAFGVNVFSLHVEGLAGRLPRASAADRAADGCLGKGIVYARRPVVVPDTEEWLVRGVRDVPSSGQRIAAGHPVCTVLARGRDRQACLAGLFSAAAAVYRDTEESSEGHCDRPIDSDHRTSELAPRRASLSAGRSSVPVGTLVSTPPGTETLGAGTRSFHGK